MMIWPSTDEQQLLSELYGINMSEDELRDRVVGPYEEGGTITWQGRNLPVDEIAYIHIYETEHPISYTRNHAYEAIRGLPDVTNDWITGPPGSLRSGVRAPAAGADPDARRVMVVHGRNLAARDAVFAFLRSLSLSPVEWEQAVAASGMGSPHNLDAVRAAMDLAQAVVVVFTAEDQAGLLPELAGPEEEVLLRGQPRQNVMLEAGMAMGIDASRTILVELGAIQRATDFEGLNVVRLTNDPARRAALRTRLRNAGCAVDDSGTDWAAAPAGGDFDACAVAWQPQPPPQLDSAGLGGEPTA